MKYLVVSLTMKVILLLQAQKIIHAKYGEKKDLKKMIDYYKIKY
jgi:hypothetical protein